MKKIVVKIFNKLGYTVFRTPHPYASYLDIKEPEFWEIYELCKPFTMTSIARMYSLYQSVNYVLSNSIKGHFVECGVWRGGSAMLIAKMLVNRNITNRKIYLLDTFEGMSEPSPEDICIDGSDAKQMLKEGETNKEESVWCLAELPDVKQNLAKTGFFKR